MFLKFTCFTFLLSLVEGKFWNDVRSYSLPRLDFHKLASEDPTIHSNIFDAITEVGALEIVGIPNFVAARDLALSKLDKCLAADDRAAKMFMSDGTLRLTVDAFDKDGVAGEIKSNCSNAFDDLRHAADWATAALFKTFDKMTSSKADHVMKPYTTYTDIFQYGDHIEHFHCYIAPAFNATHSSAKRKALDLATIDFHIDAGLMIAMTSGLYTGTSTITKN
jgi:hypothetical protein